MSTRKVAMGAVPVVGDMVQAWKTGDMAALWRALEEASRSLARHAQRAPPHRDRHQGRSPLALEPICRDEDVVEFAEAA